MTDKIYTVTDLGPGDGGKGGVVHKLATMTDAHIVFKDGGGQGCHGMQNGRGERFAFSQWGCGTLEGIPTHILGRFIVSVIGLLNEAEALRYQAHIHDPFALLTIDAGALCATPYHGIASRLKELARGHDPRGTIGTGVGEAYRYRERFPELTILAADLKRPDLTERLAAVRDRVRLDLAPLLTGEFLPEDRAAVAEEIGYLTDDGFLEYVSERFREVAVRARIVDGDYLAREILPREGVAVVERSHGILTDHYHGFHPHTSAIRTLPRFTEELLREAGYGGPIVSIGITRAYQIRHGAGPMPTADPGMADSLLPGSHKLENRYQGKVRVGPLDLVLLRYAIEAAGGPKAFDGLAITWFDQIEKNRAWRLCDRYRNAGDPAFFSPSGAIKVRRGVDEAQLRYQEALGKKLNACVPEIESVPLPDGAGRDELFALCAETLADRIDIPVRLVSLGPTELDKVCK